jgi:hypothetical protein
MFDAHLGLLSKVPGCLSVDPSLAGLQGTR